MRKKKSIPSRNRSPYGWWVASYVERFVYDDEDRRNPNRRCLAWENTILLQAKDREQAWRKAMSRGRLGRGGEARDVAAGRRGAWQFEGLTSLLPVYEKLEDGAEVFWVEHAARSVRTILGKVKTKKELEAFDDEESS